MSGLFDRFFRKKNQSKLKTNMELLPTIIQKNFEAKSKEMELEIAKEMSQVKYLHEKCNLILKDIQEKELKSKENKRFDKAAQTAKNQMENQLKKTLSKIDPNLFGNNLDDYYKYSNQSYIFLVNEINSFRKNIAFTSVYLKDEMKNFGENLQELLNKLNEIKNKLNTQEELFEFAKIKQNIEYIKLKKKEIENFKLLEKEQLELIKQKEELINKEKEKIYVLENSVELKEINDLKEKVAKLNNQKQELKIEISSMLSTINKPLSRFSSLIKLGRWKISKEDEELLNSYIINPLMALKRDVNGNQFKNILKDILKAIDEEEIELKPKEKEKKIAALQELINFNFFEKIFWRLNSIQKEKNDIENKLKENILIKNLENQKYSLKQLIREKENMKNELENNKKIYEKLTLEIKNKENAIVEFAKKALGKDIIIQN